MNDLCRSVIFNGTPNIHNSSTIKNEKVILDDNLREVLGFKHNIMNSRSAGSTSGMDRVLLADYNLASPRSVVYFFILHSLEHRELAITIFPYYVFLNEKRVNIIFIITI